MRRQRGLYQGRFRLWLCPEHFPLICNAHARWCFFSCALLSWTYVTIRIISPDLCACSWHYCIYAMDLQTLADAQCCESDTARLCFEYTVDFCIVLCRNSQAKALCSNIIFAQHLGFYQFNIYRFPSCFFSRTCFALLIQRAKTLKVGKCAQRSNNLGHYLSLSSMASASTMKQSACSAIESAKTDLISTSRQIWENPELAYNERNSAKLLVNFLQQRGFKVDE